LTALERRLIRTARSSAEDNRVPYAFERRIMARLASRPAVDMASLWSRALWRAAIPCIASALLLGAWSFWPEENPTVRADFPVEFESAVLVAVDLSHAAW